MSTLINAREELHAFRGRLIEPGDPEYEAARTVYNAMIDRRPARSRTAPTPTTSPARSPLRGNTSLPSRSAAAATTARLRHLRRRHRDRPLAAEGVHRPQRGRCASAAAAPRGRRPRDASIGLATPSGIISTTGVGVSRSAAASAISPANRPGDRQFARGRRGPGRRPLCHRERDEHPDLFWALRGGGGNFGVVTSFVFRLHEAGPSSPARFWPFEHAEVLAGTASSSVDAPDAQRLLRLPHRPPRGRRSRRSCICGRCAAWSGATPGAEAEAAPHGASEAPSRC